MKKTIYNILLNLVIGFAITFLLYKLGQWTFEPCEGICPAMPELPNDYGFPFKFYTFNWFKWFGSGTDYVGYYKYLKINFILNTVAWSIISLLVKRYFINRSKRNG